MRQCFLHSVAPTVIDVSMSIYRWPHCRGGGGRWQRSFSGRPFRENEFVTGDSHFQSVRETNLGFQRGSSSNNFHGEDSFVNNVGFQTQFYAARGPRPGSKPPFNQNQQSFFSSPQPFNGNQQLQQQPPFQSRPSRPQRAKPLDYRRWEYAKHSRPPHGERFVVLSYNLLADYLAKDHRSKLYFHIPRHILDWEWRKRSIIFELGLWSPDIMCFQEVDKFHDLEEVFKLRGYIGIWKMRTGNPVDGCAIFWRALRFRLVHEECIEFNKLGLRDNVAQICVLESLSQNDIESQSALSTSSEDPNRVVICNIHVLYNPNRGEIKLGQVRVLLERAQVVSRIWNDAPVVICGDFNCTPKSPLYNFISEQKLDLYKLDRDKVSGQASAEIHPLPKQYNPYPGVQTHGNIVQSPSMVENRNVETEQNSSISEMMMHNNNPENTSENMFPMMVTVDGKGVDSGHRDPLSGIQKQSILESISENVPPMSSLPQPHYDTSSQDLSGVSTDEAGSAMCVSADDLEKASDKEDYSSGLAEGNHVEEAVHISSQEFGPCTSLSQSYINVEDISMNSNNDGFSSVANDWSGKDGGNQVSTDAGNLVGDGASASLTNLYETHISDAFFASNIDVDEKFKSLSLDKLDEIKKDDENLGEDSESFLSKLHSSEGNEVREDSSTRMNSGSDYIKKIVYDPSLWTPMEIATATGQADFTFLEHPLKLRSTYAEVEGFPGTRDSNGEPVATSYNRVFLGTVDYIWRSEGLQTVRVLAPMAKHAMQWTPGFPTKKWGSDHIALAVELAITKRASGDNVEIQGLREGSFWLFEQLHCRCFLLNALS
ncbi:hypothetical protein Nepgr_013728 [Nepenthes gracilis]|uniref:Endonuclease/exonuclease/phosphatase domain-containing protein n=1 Tax=Nepenthes gracilis TaxID=150966 RepID=A0AAD3SIW3_NEPGR|nr:hypothetical protein Nepgr_013728 [Nepenthes gracilis]